MSRNELNRYGSQLMSMQLDCKQLDLQCWYKNKTGCSLELSHAQTQKLDYIRYHSSTNRKGRTKSQVIPLIGLAIQYWQVAYGKKGSELRGIFERENSFLVVDFLLWSVMFLFK